MNMLSLSGDMFPDTFSRREYAGPSVKETNDTDAHKEEPEPAHRTEGQLYSVKKMITERKPNRERVRSTHFTDSTCFESARSSF